MKKGRAMLRANARVLFLAAFAVSAVSAGSAGSVVGTLALGCGGGSATSSAPGTPSAPSSPGGSYDQSKWPVDDKTLCDWRGKPELEHSETAGPGALRPNVRRVFKTVGERENRHRTLICREIDTNLDGIKDVVRVFNAKGEALREEADTNYDGKVDVWLSFVTGRLAEVDEDENHDGKADVWKYYADGTLARIKRDRNFDGKPDVWEVYARGHLERMGVDDSFDGHVDRWDRDQQAMLEAEQAERRVRDEMTAAQAGPGQDGGAPAPPAQLDGGK
jgi:hypothetical protein